MTKELDDADRAARRVCKRSGVKKRGSGRKDRTSPQPKEETAELSAGQGLVCSVPVPVVVDPAIVCW